MSCNLTPGRTVDPNTAGQTDRCSDFDAVGKTKNGVGDAKSFAQGELG